MELKEFIKTAITDIVTAVEEAQSAVGDKATVMPYSKGKPEFDRTPLMATTTTIDFDIAVTSTEAKTSTSKRKGGISVVGAVGIGVGKEAESDSSINHSSRIRFSIEVLLPHNVTQVKKVEAYG